MQQNRFLWNMGTLILALSLAHLFCVALGSESTRFHVSHYRLRAFGSRRIISAQLKLLPAPSALSCSVQCEATKECRMFRFSTKCHLYSRIEVRPINAEDRLVYYVKYARPAKRSTARLFTSGETSGLRIFELDLSSEMVQKPIIKSHASTITSLACSESEKKIYYVIQQGRIIEIWYSNVFGRKHRLRGDKIREVAVDSRRQLLFGVATEKSKLMKLDMSKPKKRFRPMLHKPPLIHRIVAAPNLRVIFACGPEAIYKVRYNGTLSKSYSSGPIQAFAYDSICDCLYINDGTMMKQWFIDEKKSEDVMPLNKSLFHLEVHGDLMLMSDVGTGTISAFDLSRKKTLWTQKTFNSSGNVCFCLLN